MSIAYEFQAIKLIHVGDYFQDPSIQFETVAALVPLSQSWGYME